MNRLIKQIATTVLFLCLFTAPVANAQRISDPTPAQKWAKALDRLKQADQDCQNAMRIRLKTINDFFLESKAKVKPFAECVLGTEGKVALAGSAARVAADGLEGMVNGTKVTRPDQFREFVGERFKKMVFDPVEMKRVVDAAVAGIAGDIAAIEAKLLVDLSADLDIDDLKFDALPSLRLESQGVDAAVEHVVNIAAQDMMAFLLKEGASWVIGDAVANQLTNENDSTGKKLVINLLSGFIVDQAIEAGMQRAGYDAIQKLNAKLGGLLERIRATITYGDENTTDNINLMFIIHEGHADAKARSAAEAAEKSIKESTYLGLKTRLEIMSTERHLFRARMLHKLITGEDHLSIKADELANQYTADAAIKMADKLRAFYGGNR
jgi:hypothetical protein